MTAQKTVRERGQSLVLTAVLMIVFMGILMLAIDGGTAFARRRAAQNAADAGALAGVRVLCIEKDANKAEFTANYYATGYNQAQGVVSYANLSNRTVTVTATIPFSTTFAHFFGFNEVTAQATASAGCFSPTYGEGVLPVAWSCRPPVLGWPSSSGKCQQQWITWDKLVNDYQKRTPQYVCPAQPGDLGYPDPDRPCSEMYVIMDSESYDKDLYCIEDYPSTGTLKCDLNGDGESDWLASGGRSWLDLDGNLAANNCEYKSEGSVELQYWIEFGFSNPSNPNDPKCIIKEHDWLPDQSGVSTSIFKAVEDRRKTNPLVMVPVFDHFCQGDPQVNCNGPSPIPDFYDELVPDRIKYLTAASPEYFHVTSFAAFYITCVRDNVSDTCPGAAQIEKLNGSMPNFKSIEGFFITGTIPGMGGRGNPNIDTGVYTFYLTK